MHNDTIEYSYYFEGECGIQMGFVEARNKKECFSKLSTMFPADHGADGFITDENGEDWGIVW